MTTHEVINLIFLFRVLEVTLTALTKPLQVRLSQWLRG